MKAKRNRNVVISLFDHSGIMVEPWVEAGCQCWTVDTRNPQTYSGDGVFTDERGVHRVCHDLSMPWLYPGDKSDVAIVFAFPPCDYMAISGAGWLKGNCLRRFLKNVELFATAGEFCEWTGAPYLIENPANTLFAHWRKPDYIFHSPQYTGYHGTNNYARSASFWTGNQFSMPDPLLLRGLNESASPSPELPAQQSMTPPEFARAVFEANKGVLGKG